MLDADLEKEIVSRLGELHSVMAALRALGASTENSGIDDELKVRQRAEVAIQR